MHQSQAMPHFMPQYISDSISHNGLRHLVSAYRLVGSSGLDKKPIIYQLYKIVIHIYPWRSHSIFDTNWRITNTIILNIIWIKLRVIQRKVLSYNSPTQSTFFLKDLWPHIDSLLDIRTPSFRKSIIYIKYNRLYYINCLASQICRSIFRLQIPTIRIINRFWCNRRRIELFTFCKEIANTIIRHTRAIRFFFQKHNATSHLCCERAFLYDRLSLGRDREFVW